MKKMKMTPAMRAGWVALYLAVSTAGCNDAGTSTKPGTTATKGVTKENASKIKPGMTRDEVTAILGPPVEADNPNKEEGVRVEVGENKVAVDVDANESIWKEGDKVIKVEFEDNKVSEVETEGF